VDQLHSDIRYCHRSPAPALSSPACRALSPRDHACRAHTAAVDSRATGEQRPGTRQESCITAAPCPTARTSARDSFSGGSPALHGRAPGPSRTSARPFRGQWLALQRSVVGPSGGNVRLFKGQCPASGVGGAHHAYGASAPRPGRPASRMDALRATPSEASHGNSHTAPGELLAIPPPAHHSRRPRLPRGRGPRYDDGAWVWLLWSGHRGCGAGGARGAPGRRPEAPRCDIAVPRTTAMPHCGAALVRRASWSRGIRVAGHTAGAIPLRCLVPRRRRGQAWPVPARVTGAGPREERGKDAAAGAGPGSAGPRARGPARASHFEGATPMEHYGCPKALPIVYPPVSLAAGPVPCHR
jgi:hypothetical protein